nr:hypothetical protein [Tanacetum cinerariifolium]
MEEAILPRVYHEFLPWRSSNRATKSRHNTNLTHFLPKQIYSPCIVDWGLLNNMGCAKEIEAMLEIKVYEFITRIAKRMGLMTDEVLNSLSALTYCRALYATTHRELIDSNWRLIVKDPAPRVPRAAMPKGPRLSMQDLHDQMGNMKIHQGTLKRMARRQLYHTDRYVGLFEHMEGYYGYTLQGDYAPVSYDEENED